MATDDLHPLDTAQWLEHLTWVRGLASSLVADPNQADDLVQETWLRAATHPPGHAGNQRGWLGSILRNLLRQEHRGTRRRQERERRVARVERTPPDSDVVERASIHRALVERVTELEEPFRTTILLRYFDELAPRDIARRLGVPEDTVRSRIRRGLERLRQRLDAQHGGDRAAWLSALAPLAWPAPAPLGTGIAGSPGAAGAIGSATPAATGGVPLGVLTMNVNWKLATAGLVLLGGLAVLPQVLERDGSSAVPAPEPGPRAASSMPSDEPRGSSDARQAATPAFSVAEANDAPSEAAPHAADPPAGIVRGRVLDTHGQAVPGLELQFEGDGGTRRQLMADPAGRFEVALRERGSVSSADRAWATLLAAQAVPDSDDETIVVVAPGALCSGVVEDETGQAVAGASVTLELPSDHLLDLRVVLDASRRRTFHTRTDDRGRFDLGPVPQLEKSGLWTRRSGFQEDRRALPAGPLADLRITLRRAAVEEQSLRGRVVDAAGRPVPEAAVAAGLSLVHTDGEGEFLFDAATSLAAEEVMALHPRYGPARLAGTPGPQGFQWPPFVILRLEGEAGALRGRVVDEEGESRAGIRVWVKRPTMIALDEDRMPIHAESLLGNFPYKSELDHEDVSPVLNPNTFWSWVQTDDEGRFELGGLLDRSYVLRAMDNDSLAMVQTEPLRPGADELRLVLPAQRGYYRLQGEVHAQDGTPLPGVTLRLMSHTFSVRASDSSSISFDSPGPSTSSNAQGEFQLPDVPPGELTLVVSADGYRTRQIDLATEPLGDGPLRRLELYLQPKPEVCHIQVELAGDPTRADGFSLLRPNGRRAHMFIQRSGSKTIRPQMPLIDGRSVVVGVESGDYEWVLFLGDEEVERHWVNLVSGELIVLTE